MTLSDTIRIRRRELGLTLKELADRIGVAEATVQRYESGNIKNVRHERIVKIASALEITPAQLMGWEDVPVVAHMSETLSGGAGTVNAQKEKPATTEGDGLTEKQRELFDAMLSLDDQRLQAVLDFARYQAGLKNQE